ncbi:MULTISPECIES: ATP-binding protein [unclassified Nitratiruptor]|uniref:ATP-binding protein n=1 Tax=unclassified Nitratiruptor TaxID=2624044 RepID=UPI001916171C|nr:MULTISPECIES: ATP-binding protein [unclassified Nitratiruptor]BCD59491.1 hypothetical protein NitYY0810_C0235 [Nitratiruptor sp. YY08-10]BCD63415.1 hypothetical protein NitYY0814_C0235 [Nitratiruptor sp. YY08-14]
MRAIEYFYEHSITSYSFLPRKLEITPGTRILLTGPKFCGKYALLQSFIQTYFDQKEVLCIDFDDVRADSITLDSIQSFIDQNKIKTVVLYGIQNTTFLPKAHHLIIASHNSLDIDGFTHYRLHNLDFEEYLLFERKTDIKVAFNNFLKNGNYPELSKIDDFKKEKYFQNLLYLTFKEDFEIFKEIAYFQGYTASAYFLFNRIKERYRISKDRFYTLFESWQKNGYIYAIEKFGAKRAAKKLFFHDFTIKSRLFTQKEFPKSFENMVFLEIAGKKVYYLEPMGLYLPEEKRLILPIPFGNETRIQEKIDQILKRNKIALTKIEVITIGSSFRYSISDIQCEILPFYAWAVGKE